MLILDELGTWLNSRSFQGQEQGGPARLLIHARKLGWSVFLIVQDIGMIDKQVREAIVEYDVRNLRMDKVRIPVVGKLMGQVGSVIGFKRLGLPAALSHGDRTRRLRS